MKSVDENLVFRQYLSLLPVTILACPLMNYDAKKLTDFSQVKILIMANLCKWATRIKWKVTESKMNWIS